MLRHCVPIFLLLLISTFSTVAQTATDTSYANISDKALNKIDNKYTKLTSAVNKKTTRLLTQMQRREEKLKLKLQGIDSTKAEMIFANSQEKYQQLQTQLNAPINTTIPNPLRDYLPSLDSTQTAFRFLNQAGLSGDKLQQIQGISAQIQALQSQLQQANEIQAFLKDREAQLQSQLSQYNLSGRLLGMNKQIYYYQQQISQYKQLLHDPQKLEQTVLTAVTRIPAFQNFFQRNSYLSQLFGLPANYGNSTSIAGLQTRSQVQQLISQRIGNSSLPNTGSGSSQSFMQQQMQGAQGQLAQMQNNVASLSGINGNSGGNSDLVMPRFKPNVQKTKPFFKRLEYGISIQTTQETNHAPSYADLAITIGYKFSDRATMGVGTSYKLGVGRPLNNIKFTSEGLGLRSYLDVKAKGSFWLTGGMEYNYMQSFTKLSDLSAHIAAWQKSALIGLTKKYKIGEKKQGNLQLLYDFLHKQHLPASQALIFRMGYNF
ncbi:MAG TPA: hypothetical protein VG738_23115 [Chitinophagaceae bacterium]|nr:hypothetical protein [Chitinophagaceae bacterium]